MDEWSVWSFFGCDGFVKTRESRTPRLAAKQPSRRAGNLYCTLVLSITYCTPPLSYCQVLYDRTISEITLNDLYSAVLQYEL
jgi:hypothetical protein